MITFLIMLRDVLPYGIFKILFGDRKKYGTRMEKDDPEFKYWTEKQFDFYSENQTKGIGRFISDWGYKVIDKLDFYGKTVIELGPGTLPHEKYIRRNSKPKKYIIADINRKFLLESSKKLTALGIEVQEIETDGVHISLPQNSVDIVLSFYQLEHVYELSEHIKEIKRILSEDGYLAGAIPSEGGILWGIGRSLTTRPKAFKQGINYDKVICWEHPNFCDRIIDELDKNFKRLEMRKYPVNFLPYDLSFIVRFIYKKM